MADAPVLGTGVPDVQVQVLSPAPYVVKGTLLGGTCYVAKRAGSTPVYYTRIQYCVLALAHLECVNLEYLS